jgi:hypothetical protein
MNHWVPSADIISRFWKTPFAKLRPQLEEECDRLAIDNYTFYTKWYSNGVKSALPFLRNHPQAMNTLTNNDWGRECIDFFHARGMTVGAMLQCYTFETGALPREAVLGLWPATVNATGTAPVDIVNPAWPDYERWFAQMLREQVRLFPGLDQWFFEFEGIAAAPAGNALSHLAPAETGPEVFAPAVRRQWERLGKAPPAKDAWIWTAPVQAVLRNTLTRHLALAERVLREEGSRAALGLVYHAFGYEVPYMLDCLPSRDWWLMPWNYWGWDWCERDPDDVVRRQIEFCKEDFRQLMADGRPLCYIGNASLPTVRPETIVEMVDLCREIGATRYLGMGDFLAEHRLSWHKATSAHMSELYRLYRDRLFPRR